MKSPSNLLSVRLVALSMLALASGAGLGHAQPAPNANSVLLLAKSVRDVASSVESVQATALGYTVVAATDDQWAAMSPDQFATYRAVVLGDGMCTGRTSLDAAVANRDTWTGAVTGNVVVVGTHPAVVSATTQAARDLVRDGLRFAASGPGTGAYVTPACYLSPTTVPVDVLASFGSFTASALKACPRASHLSLADPDFSDQTDAGLSGGQCTADAAFGAWPSGFQPLAVATNAATAGYTGADGVSGAPFILIRRPPPTAPTPSMAPPPIPSAPISPAVDLLPLEGDSEQPVIAPLDLGPAMDTDPPGTGTILLLLSGRHDLFPKQTVDDTVTFSVAGDDFSFGIGAFLEAYAQWDPHGSMGLAWNPDKLRQGETPGMTDTLDPGHGVLKLAVDGGAYVGSLNVSVDESIQGDCALNLTGEYDCNIPATCIAIPGASLDLVVASIGLCVSLELDTHITPANYSVDRTLAYGGVPDPSPAVLTFPALTQPDPFTVSCYQPAGAEVDYQLGSPSTTPNLGFKLSVGLGAQVCPLIGDCFTVANLDIYTTPTLDAFDIPLTGTGGEETLGTVLADDTPPDLQAVNVSYSGNEGSPIQFSANGTKDSCLQTVAFTWNFSDGGTAFGSPTFHTFPDGPVTYSGRLTATDLAGNSASKDLSITVANLAPIVNAGPSMAAAWGIPVTFNGQATDPGTADQSTLQYEWFFGDGTPSAKGGPSVSHPYAAPGNYTATLRVCDKDAACTNGTTLVAIRKRASVIAYLGDQNGVFDTLTMLRASLADEYGQPVQGRTVAFSISNGTLTESDAGATSSTGLAGTGHQLELLAGPYVAGASFAGDGLYQPAGPSTAPYAVALKPTVLTYTGALTGAPNKTISLSAVLVDSQGKALAGRVVSFQLGTQTASATTNSSGVATTSMKLNQKNGTYSLASNFTPAGSDVPKYVGSVASSTFKLQSK